MKPAALHRLLLHVAIGLLFAGLILSEYVGLTRFGMVVAIVGILAYGGSLVAAYLCWESNDD